MDDFTTLDETIAALYALYDDVREAARPPRPRKQRKRLLAQLKVLNFEIFALEEIANEIEAADIEVRGPTDDEIADIEEALDAVSVHVARNEAFGAAIDLVEQGLDAAKAIRSGIAVRTETA